MTSSVRYFSHLNFRKGNSLRDSIIFCLFNFIKYKGIKIKRNGRATQGKESALASDREVPQSSLSDDSDFPRTIGTSNDGKVRD